MPFPLRPPGLKCLQFLSLLAGFLLVAFPAAADRIHLQGGTTMEGRVTSQSDSEVTLLLEGGGSMTLPRSLIESIHIDAPPPSPPTPTASPTAVAVQQIDADPTATPPRTRVEILSADSPAQVAEAPTEATPGLTEAMIEEIGQGRPLFGKTRDTVGVVEVKRPDQDWKELPGETALFEGDALRTQNGRTKVIIEEPSHQTELRIKEDSAVEVPVGEEGSTIELLEGKLWSRIQSLSAADEVKFRIRTPNAIAGVRGTLLYVEQVEQDTKVAVFEGEVQVQGRRQVEQQASVPRLKALLVSPQERFSSLRDVDPNELREWEEWDQWAAETKADLVPYGAAVGLGDVIGAQIDQVAAEGKLYSQMVAEGNRAVLHNRQADQLDAIKESVLRYYRDLGHLPAEDYGLTYLQSNIESNPAWQGPYLDPSFSLPVKDLWGSEVLYQIRTSEQSGRTYAVLIAPGPDRRSSDGKGDDIMALVTPL